MSQYLQDRKAVTLPGLAEQARRGDKITMLTCYDASFASLMDQSGVEVLLIGDSCGMVCAGLDSTLPVTLEQIAYHVQSVARGNKTALVLGDLPFGSYATPEQAFASSVKLLQAGAHAVKLEGGGAWMLPIIRFLTERAIPVCAHLGLTPQSVNQFGGYKVQGKSDAAAQALKSEALAVQEAGAAMLVLEAIPAQLGKEITAALAIPTIGIGAGPDCSGQVLVMHDMLGVFPGRKARFVKNYMAGQSSIADAIKAYVSEVKAGSFPGPEHCF